MRFKDKDPVYLIVCLKGGGFVRGLYDRKNASDFIRSWFDAREDVRKGDDFSKREVARNWLKKASYAGNLKDDKEGSCDYAFFAVAISEVVGAYTMECLPQEGEEWKRSLEEEGDGE